jgi:hypothetical protein
MTRYLVGIIAMLLFAVAMLPLAIADPPQTPAPTSQPAPQIDPELVRKLLGGKSAVADDAQDALTAMSDAANRLHDDLDPGDKTQELQKRILERIDRLIEQAGKDSGVSPQKSKSRRRAEPKPTGRPNKARSEQAAAGAMPPPKPPGATTAPADDKESKKRDKAALSRRWGYLPDRDRDEIFQGFDDDFHAKYRREISRYYEELAEQAAKE